MLVRLSTGGVWGLGPAHEVLTFVRRQIPKHGKVDSVARIPNTAMLRSYALKPPVISVLIGHVVVSLIELLHTHKNHNNSDMSTVDAIQLN